jgi:ABC-2 type transport system permease protein
VLAVCSEYATGTIRPTFVAHPRRRTVVGAKAAIVGGLVLVVGVVATVVAFYLGQAILHGNGYTDDNGYPAATLADGSALRAVAIVAVYPAILALLSVATGVIVRHTAPAITFLLGLLLVPFIVAALLPEKLGKAITTASPMAGLAAQERGAPMGPWVGIAVTAGWAAAALLVALWLIRRRDA